MKTIKIFEQAMCCSTGLCGVGVDPELLRISTTLNTLKHKGIEIQRYNLTSAPTEFMKHSAVREFLQESGPDKLPVVLVDDKIEITGRYPTNEEFINWMGLSADVFDTQSNKKIMIIHNNEGNCDCSGGCC